MSPTLIYIILVLILIISILFCILAIYILFILLFTRVPFVRTPKKVIEKILEEVKITPNHTVYDLGCGDAKFLIAIERATGAKTIGFEISPWAYILAKFNIWFKKSKTQVFYKNFYKENLSDADVIFCFLIDSVMPKVKNQLEHQLKKGAIVIDFAFAIKEWVPTKVIDSQPSKKRSSKIYIYQR